MEIVEELTFLAQCMGDDPDVLFDWDHEDNEAMPCIANYVMEKYNCAKFIIDMRWTLDRINECTMSMVSECVFSDWKR